MRGEVQLGHTMLGLLALLRYRGKLRVYWHDELGGLNTVAPSRQFQNYSEGIVWAPLIGDKECPDVKACLAMLLPRPVDLSPAVADLFQKFMDAPWISGMLEDRPMNTEAPKFMAS